MQLHWTWFSSLVLFGALQGIIFAAVVAQKKNHPGSGYLAGFFLVIAWNGIETFSWASGLASHFRLFDLLAFVPVFALGPCLFLYFRELFQHDSPFPRKSVLIHFLVPAWQLLAQISIYLTHLSIKVPADSPWSAARLYRLYLGYSQPLSVFIFLLYLTACFVLLQSYKKADRSGNFTREVRRIAISWSTAVLYSLGALSLAWAATVVAGYWGEDISNYYPLELGLVFFVYWTGFIGYHKIHSILIKSNKSDISSDTYQESLRRLIDLMEKDHRYLDPELSQIKLSMETGIPVKLISSTLNQLANSNFNQFVNRYRIEEVKRKLADGKHTHLTISAIALECGFNSNATFHRAFKEHTGLTPSQYLAESLKMGH
jgi:AraC-like DNA-binding protein